MILFYPVLVLCAVTAGLDNGGEDDRTSLAFEDMFSSDTGCILVVFMICPNWDILIITSGDLSFGALEMDWTNPTLGWSSEAGEDMLSHGDWTTLDNAFDSSETWSLSSSSEWASTSSEWISSEEWSIVDEESSLSLSAWFTNTQDSGIANNPRIMSEEALIAGITGYYEIDHALYPKEQDSDWHHVEINWNHDSKSFTWENRAGISWTLTPIHGVGGWDTSKLAVGSDCVYYTEGHHFATMEWVSRK